MNAEPLLTSVVVALATVRLEAILISNAAAALQGALVTTVDFDFMFRSTPVNLAKLKKFATRLDAVILRPYYPASALYRVMNDDRGLQADLMPAIHSRREILQQPPIACGENRIGQPQSVGAVLEILEKTLREKKP